MPHDPRPATVMSGVPEYERLQAREPVACPGRSADRGDGKRHRRAAVFRTEREAKQWEAQWVAERTAGTAVDPNRMTVGALLTTSLETIEPNVKAKTYLGYKHTVEHHLIPALGHRKLQVLTAPHVHQAYAAKRKVNTGAHTAAHAFTSLPSARPRRQLAAGGQKRRAAHRHAAGAAEAPQGLDAG